MAAKKTKAQTILSAISRGPKRGLTAVELSDRTGVGIATVRAYLQQFKANGNVAVAGKVETGTVGRPQLRYIAS